MGSLLSYSGLTTKIRGMQSQLINEKQLEQIVEMSSIQEVFSYLKKQPGYERIWADVEESGLKRVSMEALLRQSIYKSFAKLYRFANAEQKRFLDMYFKRYEMHVLKMCIRNILDHRDIELDLSQFTRFFEKHSDLNLNRLTECKTIDEFVEQLKNTEYYPILHQLAVSEEELYLFDYGMALDQYYFSQIWSKRKKRFKGLDLKEITQAYGQKFDLINLTWIYRAKRYYHMDSNIIYTLLIPMHYRLRGDEIQRLVEASDIKGFEAELARTYYGKSNPCLQPENLEIEYVSLMREMLHKEANRHPHSVIVMYSYLYHKEHEVKRLTTALECVCYGVPPQEAIRHVMRS